MKVIEGGVCAAKGFKAAGIHCGVKDNFTTPQPEKKDLAMVLSQVPCTAAGTPFLRPVAQDAPSVHAFHHRGTLAAPLRPQGGRKHYARKTRHCRSYS